MLWNGWNHWLLFKLLWMLFASDYKRLFIKKQHEFMKCSCRTYDSRFFGCATSIAFNWAFSRWSFSGMEFASRNFFDENFIVRKWTWPVTMIQAEIFGNFGNGWDTFGFRNLIGMGTFVGILRWRIPFDFFKFFLFFALFSSLFALFIFWILDFALEGVGQGQVWAK